MTDRVKLLAYRILDPVEDQSVGTEAVAATDWTPAQSRSCPRWHRPAVTDPVHGHGRAVQRCPVPDEGVVDDPRQRSEP